MGWYDYAPYVSVGEKKAKAAKKLEQLRKKDPDISPVIIKGRKIATTWWGMAWCNNLQSYADFSNRIGRGSAYVKNGFVLDLKIDKGVIKAKVYGSTMYNVFIKIDMLNKSFKEDIVEKIGHKISSIEDLIAGNFPKEFGDVFLKQTTFGADPNNTGKRKRLIPISGGLFPSPKEIHLNCDCPDWADMCKHVAATLYGVGARLDADPLLFFKLRGIDVNEFIKKSIDEKMQNMLKNAGKKTKRVIKDADINKLFGI